MFQSTRPAWGATFPEGKSHTIGLFQSTRPAWGATTAHHQRPRNTGFQSTRPAWGATGTVARPTIRVLVSIHAPCVGRDPSVDTIAEDSLWFQSTRPAWGATGTHQRKGCNAQCFNPRALRGARHAGAYHHRSINLVSIHAPCVGRDGAHSAQTSHMGGFNPRALRGARRWNAGKGYRIESFNPRALRGARPRSRTAPSRRCCFNPRALRGARRPARILGSWPSRFQSTRPAWGATDGGEQRREPSCVSIHAPCVGRDRR